MKKPVKAMYAEYSGKDIIVNPMKFDGDRNKENIELLKQVDIIVTNPPFSLFRKYLSQLMKYDKKFIIIGNQNAIGYKEVFPFIKENKIWIGHSETGMGFNTPHKKQKFGFTVWFTNLEHKKRNKDLILYKKYTPEEYLGYGNYDAINVDF